MLKKLQITFTFLLTWNMLNAQNILNGNMENWSPVFGQYEDPNNWTSLNHLFFSGKEVSVFKSTDHFGGTFAAKIRSVDIEGENPLPDYLPDTVGLMFCGTSNPSTFKIYGIPINQRFKDLQFYYKYYPVNGDSAALWLTFTKWDATNSSRINVASASASIGASSSYIQKTVEINYDSPLVPDTALLFVSASNLNSPQKHSELFVDNFLYDGIYDVSINIIKEI